MARKATASECTRTILFNDDDERDLSANDDSKCFGPEVLSLKNFMGQSLQRIEEKIDSLIHARAIKDWYSVEDIAKIVQRDTFTVREWCRKGRIKAYKKRSGRGKFCSWVISHEELQRYQRDGFLSPKC